MFALKYINNSIGFSLAIPRDVISLVYSRHDAKVELQYLNARVTK